MSERPVRDRLVRAIQQGPSLRSADGDAPVMYGLITPFGAWTEIREHGQNFMERIAEGAFSKAFSEARDSIKVLFQHGRDPQVGSKPLGTPSVLEERAEGAYYEVPLLDARYVRDDIEPGLRAGLYGTSFRFDVVKQDVERGKGSEHNPKGLLERTVREVRLLEFGPVTFPAYPTATAALRSLTDALLLEDILRQVEEDPDAARQLAAALRASLGVTTDTADGAGETHSDESRADDGAGETHSDAPERATPTYAPPAPPPGAWDDFLETYTDVHAH